MSDEELLEFVVGSELRVKISKDKIDQIDKEIDEII